MKKDRKQAILDMRMRGMSNADMARVLGISKQRVSEYCTRIGIGRKNYRPVRGVKYIGLRDWMWENQMSWKGLLDAMGYSYVSENLARWKAKLTGKSHTLTINDIDKILELTNMTYEEAFRRE